MAENRDINGRDEKGRFVKGNKGGGRRPMPEDVREALEELTPIATAKLKQLLEDENTPPNVRIKAIEVVYDRVYGKPLQGSEIEFIGDMGNQLEVTFRNPEWEEYAK